MFKVLAPACVSVPLYVTDSSYINHDKFDKMMNVINTRHRHSNYVIDKNLSENYT